MTRFEVVFQGQVQPGAAPDQVRANVGKLFQVSGSQLESLYCAPARSSAIRYFSAAT